MITPCFVYIFCRYIKKKWIWSYPFPANQNNNDKWYDHQIFWKANLLLSFFFFFANLLYSLMLRILVDLALKVFGIMPISFFLNPHIYLLRWSITTIIKYIKIRLVAITRPNKHYLYMLTFWKLSIYRFEN